MSPPARSRSTSPFRVSDHLAESELHNGLSHNRALGVNNLGQGRRSRSNSTSSQNNWGRGRGNYSNIVSNQNNQERGHGNDSIIVSNQNNRGRGRGNHSNIVSNQNQARGNCNGVNNRNNRGRGRKNGSISVSDQNQARGNCNSVNNRGRGRKNGSNSVNNQNQARGNCISVSNHKSRVRGRGNCSSNIGNQNLAKGNCRTVSNQNNLGRGRGNNSMERVQQNMNHLCDIIGILKNNFLAINQTNSCGSIQRRSNQPLSAQNLYNPGHNGTNENKETANYYSPLSNSNSPLVNSRAGNNTRMFKDSGDLDENSDSDFCSQDENPEDSLEEIEDEEAIMESFQRLSKLVQVPENASQLDTVIQATARIRDMLISMSQYPELDDSFDSSDSGHDGNNKES